MLSGRLQHRIEESIRLESNIADLYSRFAELFPEDYNLWEKLSEEEKHHASLIKTGMKVLLSAGEFPEEILDPSLQNIIETNRKALSLLKEYGNNPPSRKTAFTDALYFEDTSAESFYQQSMEKHRGSDYIKIWQRLNREDKDHSKKIKAYMAHRKI